MALIAEAPRVAPRRDLVPPLALAAGVFAVHVALSGRFGFHRDELYDLAAGRHPAAGYVDRPPLVPLLARGVTAVAGEHLWPLRVVAAAIHAGVVAVTVLVAAAFGGRARALVLAALAAALAPSFLTAGSLFVAGSFELLWWSLAILAVVRLMAGADPRWWLAVGGLVGLGLETRWTAAVAAAALVAGLAATAESRRLLRSPWPWAGLAVALALWSPHLAWQAFDGWPGTDAVREAGAAVRAEQGWRGFAGRQVALAGPVGVGFAVAGLVWLGRRRRWRALAVTGVLTVAGLAVLGADGYSTAPVYVAGFAAGAVAVDRWIRHDAHRLHNIVAGLAGLGLVAAPGVVPVTSPHAYGQLYHDLFPELGEEVGWTEAVDLVATVRDVLPARERPGLRVVTATAGEAAAIDLYGPARGLPRGTALSADGGYADWWPDGEPAGTVIFVRYSRRAIEPYCHTMGPVVVVGNAARVPNEAAGATVSLCRELRVSPEELRDALRDVAPQEM
ncbi:MAG TPA: glycosyltransferase family 39 protein [Acidimicrobiales bacterium]|nr:glycosyltransferase family 39 protein [Acidimicrobiales bacterium]